MFIFFINFFLPMELIFDMTIEAFETYFNFYKNNSTAAVVFMNEKMLHCNMKSDYLQLLCIIEKWSN